MKNFVLEYLSPVQDLKLLESAVAMHRETHVHQSMGSMQKA